MITMYQNKLHNERSHWLKWGILISALLIALVLLLIAYLYSSVIQEKTKGYNKAKERALAETEIINIEQVERFHGEDAYFVLTGVDEQNEPLFVYVPFDNEESIITIEQPNEYTKKAVEEQWSEECSNCLLTSITPALIDENGVWEIRYKASKDTYIYDYISMEDGSLFDQVIYNKTFN